MKVVLDHVHYIPVWLSDPLQFLNPHFSHLLNLPQKYLLSGIFYGIFRIYKRQNIIHLHWIWALIYFTLIASQAACITNPTLAQYDPTNQFNNLLTNGIFELAFKYELGLRILRLYHEYNIIVPAYYAGSLDGEFMWATLVHSYTAKDLYPWIWWKYLAVFIDSIVICVGLISNVQIAKAFRMIGLGIHWVRKSNLLYHLLIGSQVPWLLWVPDVIVLTAAFLFDLGLFFGVSRESENLGKKSKRRKKSVLKGYHTRSALSNPSVAVEELANTFKKI